MTVGELAMLLGSCRTKERNFTVEDPRNMEITENESGSQSLNKQLLLSEQEAIGEVLGKFGSLFTAQTCYLSCIFLVQI